MSTRSGAIGVSAGPLSRSLASSPLAVTHPEFFLIASLAQKCQEVGPMMRRIRRLWVEENGQDIAEYAVMLAVILVLVVGTIRLVGSNANNVFSSVASSVH